MILESAPNVEQAFSCHPKKLSTILYNQICRLRLLPKRQSIFPKILHIPPKLQPILPKLQHILLKFQHILLKLQHMLPKLPPIFHYPPRRLISSITTLQCHIQIMQTPFLGMPNHLIERSQQSLERKHSIHVTLGTCPIQSGHPTKKTVRHSTPGMKNPW